jgi:hypothetical protein
MNAKLQRNSLILAAALTAVSGAPATWADGGHYYGKHRYERSYGHGDYRHAPRPYYRRHNSDDDEKLIYGLLVGGLFGYVIGHGQQESYPEQQYTPPPRTNYQYSEPGSTCLQEREYQMTVIVGGKEAEAYGTACLQPDGSWYRGPAKVVSR